MANVLVRVTKQPSLSVAIAEEGETIRNILVNRLQMDNIDTKQIVLNQDAAGLDTVAKDGDTIFLSKGTQNG